MDFRIGLGSRRDGDGKPLFVQITDTFVKISISGIILMIDSLKILEGELSNSNLWERRVNPVPRTYVRGFGALPSAGVQNIHRRAHARGVLWYRVKRREQRAQSIMQGAKCPVK